MHSSFQTGIAHRSCALPIVAVRVIDEWAAGLALASIPRYSLQL